MTLKTRSRDVVLGLAAALAVCSGAGAAEAPAELASALPAIDRVDGEWFAAMKAGDATRLAAPYSQDAVFVTPTGQVVIGRTAIEDLYRSRAASGRVLIEGGIHRDGVHRADDGLVFEWGHGGSTARLADGRLERRSGPYLTVWRRNANGQWEIVRNMAF